MLGKLILWRMSFVLFLLFQSSAFADVPFPKMWMGNEGDKQYLYRDPYVLPGTVPAPVNPPAALPTPMKLEVVTLDPNRPYFHWADQASASRWESNQGRGLSSDEFNVLRTNGKGEAAGGGFYISKDFVNSDGYGVSCVKVTLNQKVNVVKGDFWNFFPESGALLVENQTQWQSQALESAGIDGVAYANLNQENFWWINLFKRNDIVSLTPATVTDFLSVADSSYNSILSWLSLATKANLDPAINPKLHSQEVGQKFPIFERFLNQQLTSADRDLIWDEILNHNKLRSYYYDLNLQMVPSLAVTSADFFQSYLKVQSKTQSKDALSQYLFSQLTQIFKQHFNEPGVRAKLIPDYESYKMVSKILPPSFIGPFSLTSMTEHFQNLLPNDFSNQLYNGSPFKNDFLTHYFRSFAFIDLADRLEAQDQGNAAIWSLYDEPGVSLSQNWESFRLEIAQKEADQQNKSYQQLNAVGNNFPLSTADQLYFGWAFDQFIEYKRSLDQMKLIASRLSGGKVNDIRGEPVIAGGDYVVNGIHYYRVNQDELKIIQANPYLWVETVADPNEPTDSKWVLARHEYPSARTYTHFKDKLSNVLLQSLIQADSQGVLKDTSSETFHELTRKVLNELWNAGVGQNDDVSTVYQTAISIHPFPDENGRTMRFLYSLGNGMPLVLRNWDWDLFLSKTDFDFEQSVGQQFLGMLSLELMQLNLQNPDYPKAYDAKSPYAYFFDNGNLKHVADGDYLNEARKFFNDGQVQQRVQQKLILEVGNLKSSPCSLALGRDLKD